MSEIEGQLIFKRCNLIENTLNKTCRTKAAREEKLKILTISALISVVEKLETISIKMSSSYDDD